MNYEKIGLFVKILEFSLIAIPVIMIIIQKIKETIKINSNVFKYLSAILSLVLGFVSAKLFSDFSTLNCFVCGVIVYAGADTIYKSLEDKKIVSSINDIQNKKVVEIPVENEIK